MERGIGVLKDRMIRHLRSSEGDPREAAWAMVTAHNGLARVGKYSPQQCVFGRNFTDADRLHDGQDLPFWSSVSSDERMRKTLEIRTQAETSYRKATVEDKISRARNSQSRPVVKYHTPGTWSSTGGINNLQMHEAMPDLMFLGCLSRWYGPARILALETKVTFSGEIRQPHQLAWIISQGRLKRAHVLQLRHASEREKVIAEDGQVITTPWTFGDVAAGLNKGAFEDLVEDRALRREQKPDDRGAKQKRRKFGSRMASVREGGSDRAARSAEMSLKPTNLRERRESLQLKIHGENKNGRGLRRKNSSGRSLEKTKMWMAAAWWTMRTTCR